MHFRQKGCESWGLFSQTLSAISSLWDCLLWHLTRWDAQTPHESGAAWPPGCQVCRCIPCRGKPYFLWLTPPGRSPTEVEFTGVHSLRPPQTTGCKRMCLLSYHDTARKHVDTEWPQLPRQPEGSMQVRLWTSTTGYLEGRLEFTGRLVLF